VTNGERGLGRVDLLDLSVLGGVEAHSIIELFLSTVRESMHGNMVGE
jgi:hypothetical protein